MILSGTFFPPFYPIFPPILAKHWMPSGLEWAWPLKTSLCAWVKQYVGVRAVIYLTDRKMVVAQHLQRTCSRFIYLYMRRRDRMKQQGQILRCISSAPYPHTFVYFKNHTFTCSTANLPWLAWGIVYPWGRGQLNGYRVGQLINPGQQYLAISRKTYVPRKKHTQRQQTKHWEWLWPNAQLRIS